MGDTEEGETKLPPMEKPEQNAPFAEPTLQDPPILLGAPGQPTTDQPDEGAVVAPPQVEETPDPTSETMDPEKSTDIEIEPSPDQVPPQGTTSTSRS